jgi:hypothetical protein
MVNEYKMKHATKSAVNWKIIIIIISSLVVLAVAYVIYWYFPTILKFIDNKVLSLFSSSSDIVTEETITEDNPVVAEDSIETSGQEDPEEDPVEEIVEVDSGEEEDKNNKSLPAIIIRIYEGPLYSKADDICYYRIIADVSGEPFPEITFSNDDSLGSLGPDKVQINISRDSGSYTLSATAENSEGSVSDSIKLVWNCNRNPDINGIHLSTDTLYVGEQYEISVEAVDLDGDDIVYTWSVSGGTLEETSHNPVKWNTPDNPDDYTISVSVTDGAENTSEASIIVYVGTESVDTVIVDQEPDNLNLPRNENEGGYIESGGTTFAGGDIYSGDSDNNKACSGFVSFDISSLAGKTVDAASLTFSNSSVSGDPLAFFELLWINVLDWGAEPITQDDFNLIGTPIASYNIPNITCNVSKLKEELQAAINAGKSRFQIRIHFSGPKTDSDSLSDGWKYTQSNVSMDVTVSQ